VNKEWVRQKSEWVRQEGTVPIWYHTPGTSTFSFTFTFTSCLPHQILKWFINTLIHHQDYFQQFMEVYKSSVEQIRVEGNVMPKQDDMACASLP
jgi:hypothetical protein